MSAHREVPMSLDKLEHYTAAADLSDRHSRLSLDHGLAVHRASLQWAGNTVEALSAAPAPAS